MMESRDVKAELIHRIGENGQVPFVEFMDLALYWPNGGYYARKTLSNFYEDYYTSPVAHPLFGALICVQVYQLWLSLGKTTPFWVIEYGAGGGVLCRDFFSYSRHFPNEFRSSLRYVCVDRGNVDIFEWAVPDFDSVHRVTTSRAQFRNVVGCVISNEFVDAMPTHRIVVKEGEIREVYVTIVDDCMKEVLRNPSVPAILDRVKELEIDKYGDCEVEINLAMDEWIGDVGNALKKGFVITIDYGNVVSDQYPRHRKIGTLTSFYRHMQSDEIYSDVGCKDITSHVDFTSLINRGNQNGLSTFGLVTQREFLKNLGAQEYINRLVSIVSDQKTLDINRAAMLDITKPGGLGDFKVLIQGKNVQGVDLWGLTEYSEVEGQISQLPVPLIEDHHLGILERKHPHLSQQWL